MDTNNWLKNGAVLPDQEVASSLYVRGQNWQLYMTAAGGYALLVTDDLYRQWTARDMTEDGLMLEMTADGFTGYVITVPAGEMISSVEYGPFGQSAQQVLAFAKAVRTSRIRTGVSLADGLYISRFSLVLPTFQDQDRTEDDLLIGRWICGGMNVPLSDTERIRKYASWLPDSARIQLLELFGLEENKSGDGNILSMPSSIDDTWEGAKTADSAASQAKKGSTPRRPRKEGAFSLPGRVELERFFREEILDVIDREEEYRRFGVGFPGATLLYGPSGSGKTFAVEKLADYLGWPVYRITSGTVGSKYIHETSQKISAVFDAAIKDAPSVLIMDELEAFLSSRDTSRGSAEAHMEEVGEFLRRIPEAAEHHVLLFGMTNMPDSIDSAILRKGRFDHMLLVGMPSAEEVRGVLEHSLEELPTEGDLELDQLADALAGRPMSDVAFVVTEAGRICVRDGRKAIDAETLREACRSIAPVKKKRRIGF